MATPLIQLALDSLDFEQTMNLAEETLNEALQFVPPDQVETCKAVLQIVYDNLK